MTTHPVHGEPEVTEPHARMIVFTWDLGAVDEHGRTGTPIGELVVSHRLDAKAFTANLRTGVRVPHAGTSYRYQLGQPGWHMSQPIARYSRPRLLAYAARALAALREADPAEIAHVFVAVESWEQWVGSRTPPVQRATRGAKVTTRDGIRWISYRGARRAAGHRRDAEQRPQQVLRRAPPRRLWASARRTARRRRDPQAVAARLPVALRLPVSQRPDPGRAAVLMTTPRVTLMDKIERAKAEAGRRGYAVTFTGPAAEAHVRGCVDGYDCRPNDAASYATLDEQESYDYGWHS